MPDLTIPIPIKDAIPLDRVRGLTEAQLASLQEGWITTVQDLLALGDVPGGRDYLLSTLDMDDQALDSLLSRAQQMAPRAGDEARRLLEQAMAADYGAGAVEPPPAMRAGERYDTLPFAGALPEVVNYTDQFPPARNQGDRGTCVAHAAAAVREFLEIQAGVTQPDAIDLSEQFIYWWCKEHDNLPNIGGTYPHMGIECLAELGTVTEDEWPYNPQPEADDEGQGPPPEKALDEAWRYRVKRIIRLNPKNVEDIKAALANNRAVLFTIPIFDSWYQSAVARRYGKIAMPLPNEKSRSAHAMALVGYVDDDTAPGGGYFLLRNSWSPWGFDCPQGNAYGAIPFAFITAHNMAAISADRASPADVYLRANEDDQGEVPRPVDRFNSPDLWVRQAEDGEEAHQTPRGGEPNWLYIRAWNQGPEEAKGAKATLYAAPASPSIWPGQWQEVGEVEFPPIAGGKSQVASLTWTPADDAPLCFLARLSSPTDPEQHPWSVRTDNNLAQKNLVVLRLEPGQSQDLLFPIYGLPGKLTLLDLDVDRRQYPRACGRPHRRATVKRQSQSC